MPAAPPPGDLPGNPHLGVLETGTPVWCVHGAHPACAVNPTPRPTVPGGGRFDSLTGDYAHTYLGDSPTPQSPRPCAGRCPRGSSPDTPPP